MSLPNLTHEQRTAFADLLGSKDVDVLREMLALVYDAAIQAQFDDHVGAAPHERTEARRDLRNGSRTRGLNTRADRWSWRFRVLATATSGLRCSSISGAANALLSR